jgi:hypothetical protein
MRGVLLFLALMLPVSVFAASASPTGVATVYRDAAGITRAAEVMVRMESATYGVKYALQRVAVSPASMGRMAVRAVGGPWGAAIVAGMALYSYVYDDGHFEFPGQTISKAAVEAVSDQYACRYPPGTVYQYSSLILAVISDCDGSRSVPSGWVFRNNCSAPTYPQTACNGHYPFAVQQPVSSLPDPFIDPSNQPYVLSDSDVGQHIFDNVDSGASSSSLPRDIANDSVNTGNYSDDWPELQDHLSDLSDALDQADSGTNPFTPTDVASFRNPEDKPQSSGNADSGNLELPTDYNREATQQAILNKLSEEPPAVPPDLGAEVPLIDFETVNLPATFDDSEFDSVGVGVCPAPLTIDALGASINVSYQPFCDLAIRLNPFFVSLGWLSAAFIVFGRGSIV